MTISELFNYLSYLVLIVGIIGLFSPKTALPFLWNPTRTKVILIYALLLIVTTSIWDNTKTPAEKQQELAAAKEKAEEKAKEEETKAEAATEQKTKEEETKVEAEAEAEQKAKEEAAKAKAEAEQKAKAEAEQKAKEEAAKAKAIAEEKKKQEEAEAAKIFKQLFYVQIENENFLGDKTYILKGESDDYFFVPDDDFNELVEVQEKNTSDLIGKKEMEKALKNYEYKPFDNDDGILTVIGDSFDKMLGQEKQDIFSGYDIVNSDINIFGYLSEGFIGRDEDNFKRVRIENLSQKGNELVNDNELAEDVLAKTLGSWFGKGNEVFEWYAEKQQELLSPNYYLPNYYGDSIVSSGFFIKEFDDYEVLVRGIYTPSIEDVSGYTYTITYELIIQYNYYLPVLEKLYEKYN